MLGLLPALRTEEEVLPTFTGVEVPLPPHLAPQLGGLAVVAPLGARLLLLLSLLMAVLADYLSIVDTHVTVLHEHSIGQGRILLDLVTPITLLHGEEPAHLLRTVVGIAEAHTYLL